MYSTKPQSPTLAGALYPNGEFGLSRARGGKIVSEKSIAQPEKKNNPKNSPIGFSDVINSENEAEKPRAARAKRGSQGIGNRARRFIRNACFLLEKEDSNNSRINRGHRQKAYGLAFLTLTLPTLDAISLRQINSNWSLIANQILREISRKLASVGLGKKVLQVSELQEKRSAKARQEYFHLHIILRTKKKGDSNYRLSPKDFREIWKRVICRFAPRATSADFRASENIQPIKKSVCAYLSKYLSKQKSKGASMQSYIKSWYNCTKELREEVKDKTLKGQEILADLFEIISKRDTPWGRKKLNFCKEIRISGGIWDNRIVGYSGALTFIGLDWILENL